MKMKEDTFRQQVLNAAQKLFRKTGLHKATMEDVAHAVGKGKSTLYYYFRSKEEIFDAVLEMEINEIILETIKAVNKAIGLQHKLRAFSWVKYQAMLGRKAFSRTLELGMDADELYQYAQIRKEAHLRYLAKEKAVMQQLFIAAMEKGEMRRLTDAELDQVIMIFLSSLRGLTRESLLHESVDDPAAAINTFCRLVLHGLVK